MKAFFATILLALSVLCCAAYSAAESLDLSELPAFEPAKISKVRLASVGSDSMGDLMQLWVEAHRKLQPQVIVRVVSRGSATAPAALIEGSADLGPMARTMKSVERDEFLAKYGFAPTQIRTAIAPVAVYVNAKNPIGSISLKQLDAAFGKDLKRADKRAARWRDLDISEQFSSAKSQAFGAKSLVPLGRDESSFLSSFFRQRVLLQGEFLKWTKTYDSANQVFSALRQFEGGIAFAEMSATELEGVKLLAIREEDNGAAVLPTVSSIENGLYPLARFLNIYVVRQPDAQLDPALMDFLSFILSRDGQLIVQAQGMVPLSAQAIAEERAKLQ